MTKAQKAEQAEAMTRLREWIKPGDTVYTILRHRSKSGMLRVIQLVKIENGEPVYLGYNAAVALGDRYDNENEGVRVGGCGMDMGFHLVYNLSSALFRDGYGCLGARCPSSAHTNGQPREETYTAETCPGRPCGSECDHKGTPRIVHKDGYALNHRWL